ncbi:uncharacterized protein LOC118481656 [Helianthus annuus]|uniref:uncharacterized protein LOC118481656 n=1 Tax=Helianthus annuus TaxID=4232 RepID=UPI0016533BDE|nr:uncharacterized protein LOC118481656 [Helianthus annuus]
MARSEEMNSHSLENNDNDRVNITKGELRTLIDTAVCKAVKEQFKEVSETYSRTSSVPHSKSVPKTHSEAHSKPPSKKNGPKKEDVEHSSNQHSVSSKRIVFNDEPRTKSCTYKLRSLKNSEESKRKREEDNSRGSEKKHKGNTESKKFGSGKGSQRAEEKPKCSTCQKRHFGKCRLETKSQSGPPACGLCKSREHKTIDCKKIKDATCYSCNEKGNHSFPMSLLPLKLAGFDIVLGMDWLSDNRAQIICNKKQVVVKTSSVTSFLVDSTVNYGITVIYGEHKSFMVILY